MRRTAPGWADELDAGTDRRLLDGALAPDDAPPGYAGTARIIERLQAPASAQERRGEAAVVASMLGVMSWAGTTSTSGPGRARPQTSRMGRLVAVGSLAATLLLGSAIAAGALPGVVQGVTSDLLGKVGINVPGDDTDANTAQPDDSEAATDSAEAQSPAGSQGNGREGGLAQAVHNVTNPVALAVLQVLQSAAPGANLGPQVAAAAQGAASGKAPNPNANPNASSNRPEPTTPTKPTKPTTPSPTTPSQATNGKSGRP